MRIILASIALFAAAPLIAGSLPQDAPGVPGALDASRVQAGTYAVDGNHTYVTWMVDHMGFSALNGQIGGTSGTLEIDPANLGAAKVDVTFDLTTISHPTAAFVTHLKSGDFFDVENHPTAHFVSTGVEVEGMAATITGNLTIKGTTLPVSIDAEFYGAGTNPMNQKLNIGFIGNTTISRSAFGLGYATPIVGDEVQLTIDAAFVKS